MQRKSISLKIKLNLAFIFIVVLVTSLLTLVVVLQIIEQTEKDYLQSINQQIELVDQSVFQYANNIASNTKMLAEMPLIKQADDRITSYVNTVSPTGKTPMRPHLGTPYEVEVYGILNSFQTSHPSVKNASLGVEKNGGFVKSPPSDRFDGYDARDREWYKKALERPDEVVISEIYTTSSDEKVLLCVTTVRDENNQIVGVVTVDFDLKDLSDVISSVKIGHSGYMILTDSQGLIIAHPQDPSIIGLSLNDIGFGAFVDGEKVEEKTLKINTEKGDILWTQSRPSKLTTFPLNYIVVIDQNEFYNSARDVSVRIGFIVILMIGFATLLSYFISQRLSKPIEELNLYVDTLASGALDARINVIRDDEIGHLAQRFNVMAESLERSQNHLEDMVKERTQAFETANAYLLETNDELKKTLELLKTTQDQLIQSEKMAGLSTLVAGVAHEINTPLGVAISAASLTESILNDLKLQTHQGTVDESSLMLFNSKCSKSLEILNRNLERTSSLVEHFKQVSVDHTSESPRLFKLKNYVEDVLIGLKSRISEQGHTLKVICDETLEIYSFPGALSQIITHLVLNTLDHGFATGFNGIITMNFSEDKDSIVFSFSDNGKGMSELVKTKAFEPFFTTNRAHGGTGLGLHIVYNLVTLQLSGTIVLNATLGQGTTFIITLPKSIDTPS